MKIGTVFSQADAGVDAAAIRAWAQRAEAAGFHHLLCYDHVLGASVDRLGPGPFGSFPAAPYTNEHTFYEVLTLFSHLAAVTTTLEFASSVVILPQRQTALAAKQIATMDLLSGGRMNVAVGVGWNPAEYAGLGASFATRTAQLEEQIDVLRRLWTEPLVSFDGRFHHLDRVGINPLPTRNIPIWMGSGAAEPVLQRVARKADGWMPLLAPGLDKLEFGPSVVRLRQICEDQGRDPASLQIWGRCYISSGEDPVLEAALSQALALGCSHFSVGFNRMAAKDVDHAAQLEAVIAAKPRIDALVS